MTVQASEDDGKTWPVSRLIYGGFSSYSDMTTLPDGRIGLVFERDSFTRITFVPIEPEWRNGN
jgi:sialidase-1